MALARLLLILFASFLVLTGCVRRRLTVRTNPPGATVYVDKQLVGTSPASTSTLYYGTREIEVVRDGFRTEKVLRNISPPWYQLPPLDFVSETLWPWEIRDERVIDITMVPYQPPATEVLEARANELRLQASQGMATSFGSPLGQNPIVQGDGITVPVNPLPGVGPGVPGSGFPNQGQGLQGQAIQGQPFGGPGQIQGGTGWQPGQVLGNFLQPGGQPPQRIPEAGILPGGGYRPEIPE